MIKKFKKMLSLLSAAAVTASACVFTVPANAVTAPLFYSECEDLELAGDAQITDNVYGGYNTGFSEKAMYGFRVTVVFHLKLTLLKMECIILRYVHGNILMKQEESSLIA